MAFGTRIAAEEALVDFHGLRITDLQRGVAALDDSAARCLLSSPAALRDVYEQLRTGRAARAAGERQVTLPVHIAGRAALVSVEVSSRRVTGVVEVPGLMFVLGDDNIVFGAWDRLIAYRPAERQIRVLPGHGGEIIPGRLVDHVAALRERVVRGRLQPVQLDIDPTMVCPSRCLFCFSAGYRKTRTSGLRLSNDLLLRTIGSWIDLGVKVVRFDGGGDPLAHPRCLDAIEYAAARGVRTALLTAGDALHPPDLDRLVAAKTYVRVSLNAASDEVRSAVHSPRGGISRVESLYELMRRLAEQRAEAYGTWPQPHMLLGATFMLHPLNVSEIDEAARRVMDVGFDHISFRVILGRAHAAAFTAELRSLAEEKLRRAAALSHDQFRVFVPTRDLTDTGYAPAHYFSRCISSTHRVLVEVGRSENEAAIVPCGRYRGHGFTSGESRSPHVLAQIDAQTNVGAVWGAKEVNQSIGRYPAVCGDCIDRSANLMFNAMLDALSEDLDTEFYRARATGQ